ncbi:MAG: hypothetical protein WD801_06025 [Gemmatimonadaceae bacterium]
MRYPLLVLLAALTSADSPGALLSRGTQLVYASAGQDAPPWTVEQITRDTTLGGMHRCSVIHLRTSPAQAAPEHRMYCVRGDTLFAWDSAQLRHAPLRPVGPDMSMEVKGRTVTSTYVTGERLREAIGSVAVDVLVTTVTTRDSTGAVVRRLRERYSVGLATATGGVFEIPDSTASSGWRQQRAFELVRVSTAGDP